MVALARFHPTVVVEMTANHAAILDLLSRVGYTHLTDLDGVAVDSGRWPLNLVASMKPVIIPEVGTSDAAIGTPGQPSSDDDALDPRACRSVRRNQLSSRAAVRLGEVARRPRARLCRPDPLRKRAVCGPAGLVAAVV